MHRQSTGQVQFRIYGLSLLACHWVTGSSPVLPQLAHPQRLTQSSEPLFVTFPQVRHDITFPGSIFLIIFSLNWYFTYQKHDAICTITGKIASEITQGKNHKIERKLPQRRPHGGTRDLAAVSWRPLFIASASSRLLGVSGTTVCIISIFCTMQ